METSPPVSSPPAAPSVPMFAGRKRPPWWVVVPVLAVAAVAIGVAGWWGGRNHPTLAPPEGSAAEAQIVATFGMPADADSTLVGDLLVERFYIRDAKAGQFYVLDFGKGIVTDVVMTRRKDFTGSYTVLLDNSNMEPRRQQLELLTQTLAPPAEEFSGNYLGLKLQTGTSSSFAVNYSGAVPTRRMGFRGPRNLQWTSLLGSQPDLSAGAQIINVKGTNFLLSSTQWFPGFLTDKGIDTATFVSQVIFIDVTGSNPTGSAR